MGMLLALTGSAMLAAEEEEEYKLDLPWAKQMTYNNDPVKAAYAIRWLGEQKTNDVEAIKLIVEHLGDDRQSAPDPPRHVIMRVPMVGDVAADALKQIGAPAVPELIKYFESKAKPEAKSRGLNGHRGNREGSKRGLSGDREISGRRRGTRARNQRAR